MNNLVYFYGKLVMEYIETIDGLVIYGANINGHLSGMMQRYLFVITKLEDFMKMFPHLSQRDPNQFTNIPRTYKFANLYNSSGVLKVPVVSIQTRMSDSLLYSKLVKQTLYVPNTKGPLLTVMSRTNNKTTYSFGKYKLSIIHKIKNSYTYQYPNRIPLWVALETYNCIIQ